MTQLFNFAQNMTTYQILNDVIFKQQHTKGRNDRNPAHLNAAGDEGIRRGTFRVDEI